MSALKPDVDSTHDLGTTALRWRKLWVDSIATTDEIAIGGNLTITGNLQVDGATTTINSTTLTVDDKNIVVAQGAAAAANWTGSGLTVDGASATLLYTDDGAGTTQWEFNNNLQVEGNVLPQADDSHALGSTSLGWADVFVTDGGTITFANAAANGADLTLTHSTGALTLSGTDKLQFQDDGTYINSSENGQLDLSADGNMADAILLSTASGGVTIDAGLDIVLDADGGDITLSDSGISKLAFDMAGTANAVVIKNGTDGDDLIFKLDAGATEVMRLDDSAGSLLMAGTKKIEFGSAAAYIHHDGTDLKIADDADINLVATTDILLDAGGLVRVDGNLVPHSADGGSLGTQALEWSDIYLADSGVISLGTTNGSEVTLSHVEAIANRGLLLNGTHKLMFGSNGSFVQETAAGKILMSGSAAASDAVKLNSSNAAGGVDINAGTGGITIDSTGSFSVDGAAASNITVATDANGEDFTISVTGATDSSLLLSSTGTGTDAIGINATAGGIDIDASGALSLDSATRINIGTNADKPIDIDATTFDVDASGGLTLTSTTMAFDPSSTFDLDAAGNITIDGLTLSVGGDNDTGAITFKSSNANATIQTAAVGEGGVSGKVHLNSGAAIDIDAATGASIDSASGDITLDAATGSVTIEGAEAGGAAVYLKASNAAGGIDIDAGTAGVDLDTTGLVSLTSSLDAAKAVEVVASAGGIDILASGAAAGEDIDIVATGSSVNIESTEGVASALYLNASNAAGGVDIDAGTGGFDLDTSGQVALTSSQAAADAVIIEATDATGGIDLSAGGAVVVSVDANSVDIAQNVNITGTTPTLTIGDAGEEDAAIIFDGAAVDFHIGLDDSEDKLQIGLGSALGTTPNMTLNSADRDVTFAGDIEVQGGKVTLSNGATINSETEGELALTEDLIKAVGDLTVTGNLTVSGTTTTVDSTTITVADKDIQVNKGGSTAGSTGAGLEVLGDEVDGAQAVVGYLRVSDASNQNLEFKAPGNAGVLTIDINATKTLTVAGSLNIEGDSVINQDLTTDSTVTFSSVNADGGVTVDDLTLDGTSLTLSSGDLELKASDAAGGVILNANGGSLTFKDDAVSLLSITNSSTDVVIKPLTTDKDIIFQEDGGTEIARFDSSAESLLMAVSKKIQWGDASEAIYADGDDIHFEVGAGGDINIPSAIGLKFGTDAQGIEADADLDLTVTAGRDLILTPTADVVVSGTAKLEFNTANSGEHITGNGTNLTVASGADILLDAGAAVVVPSGIPLEFVADSGESISGDGTNLTVSSGGDIILNPTSAVRPAVDSADDLGADGTAWRKLYVDDIDLNGQGRIDLDADADTSIRASADDVISFEVGGFDELHLNATELYPEATDGLSLGTASKSFADLYLANAGVISFQDASNAADITVTHVLDTGLTLKNTAVANADGMVLTLQTGDTDIAANDVLGSLEFQAPDEGTGTDAQLVAAAISAISEGDFAASSNATKLSFKTGASEAATEKMSLSSGGVLTLASAGLVIPDNATIGSASGTDAITINAAGDIALSSTTASTSPTTGAFKVGGGLGVAGALNVAGSTELDGSLKVVLQDFVVANAAGSVERFKVAGGSGNTEIAGTLEVDGNCTLGNASSDLHTVNGGLTITGVSTTSNVTSTAVNKNMDGSEYVLLVTADDITVTLPDIGGAEAASGQRFIIKRTAAHTSGVTVSRAGSDLIDGGTSVVLGAPSNGVKSFIEVISDGTDYHIITSGGSVTVS